MNEADGKRIAIYGRSGSGKSTLMDYMLAHLPQPAHVILFDYLPTRRPWATAHGYKEVTDASEIERVVAEGYGRGFKIWFRPSSDKFSQRQALHAIARYLNQIQEKRYEAHKPLAPITLAVDEMSGCYPVEKLPTDMQGFSQVCNAGRHFRISVIGATQRPAQVSTEFRGNLDYRYYLSLKEPADLKAVEKTAGKQVAGFVGVLPPYLYICQDPDGNYTEGQTQK